MWVNLFNVAITCNIQTFIAAFSVMTFNNVHNNIYYSMGRILRYMLLGAYGVIFSSPIDLGEAIGGITASVTGTYRTP